MVPKEALAALVCWALRERLGSRATGDHRALGDPRDLRERLAAMVTLASQDPWGSRALMARRGSEVRRASKEYKGSLGRQGSRVCQA